MKAELTENGRSAFDRAQKNLSSVTSATDSELAAWPCPFSEMFGGEPESPETRRESARRTQDKLDRQGREAFAAEYAANQAKNY